MEKEVNMSNNTKRVKDLSDFVLNDTTNWKQNDNGDIVDIDAYTVPFLEVSNSNGQASKIKIEEPSGDSKTMTLRLFNMLSYSMYNPMEVVEFLTKEFPAESKETGLDQKVANDFHCPNVVNYLQQGNLGNPKTVIDKNNGMVVIADTIQRADPKATVKSDVKRNTVQTHKYLVDSIDHYNVEAGPIVPNSNRSFYITSGSPAPRVVIKASDALSVDWDS